jgi:putative DNA methylase
MDEIKCPKKLIEVALPLDDINKAAAREKSIRHGHPSNLHRWWARRPLAAARAVIFAQMVNDPGYERELGRGVNKKEAEKKREGLFKIIRELVKWENTNNERVLKQAREAIWESWKETCHLNRNHPRAALLFDAEKLPAFHDPFTGGGAIPLEAQRLGLEAHASDLNPVAVMINKAMIEIPPRFAGISPVGPVPAGEQKPENMGGWSGASGLAEDVRRYGHWIQEEALKRIGQLYPKVKVTSEMTKERRDLKGYVGKELTIIAWLWARTVKSPNPMYNDIDVPLVSNFIICNKKGKQAWIDTISKGHNYKFQVAVGTPPETAKAGTKIARGANFRCIMSETPIGSDYIKNEGTAGRMGVKLMAIVAKGQGERLYLSPDPQMEKLIQNIKATWKPEAKLAYDPKNLWTPAYGLTKFGDLFTSRQLLALTTLSDLIPIAKNKAQEDAKLSGMVDDGADFENNGTGATAYGEAIAVYLSLVISKLSDSQNALCPWEPVAQCSRQLFNRQGIPMVWDFAEGNIFSNSSGSFSMNLKVVCNYFSVLQQQWTSSNSKVYQANAINQKISDQKVISTDPPYYDNIGYAILSDFFYTWLRRSLKPIFPQIFSTIEVPKADELVATPYRHGSKDNAESFFLNGMTLAMSNLKKHSHSAFPVTIYYAFKQSETKDQNTSSTGWETFLEAIIQSGFEITGTWPMRTELKAALKTKINSLASSIILVCRQRFPDSETISRREFQRELRIKMPDDLGTMIGGQTGQQTPIAPVDLAQASIGPGMAVFSKYEAVLNQDGSKMGVHDALILINREITEYLNPDEASSFDLATLFCTAWFEQYGWKAGAYGEADTLTRAKGTAVDNFPDTKGAWKLNDWLDRLRCLPSGNVGFDAYDSGH